jgi:ATP-dependent protease ClpP protease subunit
MAATTGKKTAQIRLYGPIDSWGAPFGVAASEVASALDSIGDADVEMHVHSPGGDAFEGLAIMNLLRQHQGGVSIVVDGLAASAASIVAMGADTVTMVPGSQMMIHDASALAIGQADDMREAATMLDSISSNAADQYAAKSGKPSDEMRAAMKATTWFKAQEAVDAGLADAVLAPETEQAKAAQAAAASLRFDLSMYRNAPVLDSRCQCGANGTDVSDDPRMEHKDECPMRTQTPAEPPETPTETEEADTMSDTLIQGLRERFGLPEDADDTAVLAKADELLDQATKPTETKPADGKVDLKAAAAALEADGKLVVSKARFDALAEQAAEGAKARATQIERDRDELIGAAMDAGKISRSDATREVWAKEFARDFDAAKADLESLPARFPVGAPQGHQDDGSTAKAAVFTDDEAEALAALSGTTKEALSNG